MGTVIITGKNDTDDFFTCPPGQLTKTENLPVGILDLSRVARQHIYHALLKHSLRKFSVI